MKEQDSNATPAELKAAIPPDLVDLNMATLEGRRLKLDALIGACEAIPFIAERRLVIVQDLLKHHALVLPPH